MKSATLNEMAMRRYVSALRSGTATAYECYRFFQTSHRYKEEDRSYLLRVAVLTLLKRDPLFLITGPPFDVGDLAEEEIETCVTGWSLEGDEPLRSLLAGHLWLAASRREEGRRRSYAERALVELQRAANDFSADLKYLELYSSALEATDDSRYVQAIQRLIDATEPEWRAPPIKRAMRTVLKHADYDAYVTFRDRWSELPPNAHLCECDKNFVADMDGVIALERGSEDLGQFLQSAADVRGCPHLNTGSISFALAGRLIERGILLDEVVAYLDRADALCPTKEAARLRAAVEDALQ